MNSLVVKVAAAATVLAATAAAAGSYFSAGFLSSPPFLWVAANVIIIWLLSSSRRRDDAVSSASAGGGHADVVLNAVDDMYPASDYEGYSSSSSMVSSAEAPLVFNKPIKRQQPREVTRGSVRRPERARGPKKPAAEPAKVSEAGERRETRRLDDGKEKRGENETPTRSVVGAAGEAARPKPNKEDEEDVSMDSLWQSMLQRRTVRPVNVRKSETWGNDEMPRLQRAAETAAARRREMRKAVSSARPPPPQEQASASAVRQLGWRTRDVLVRAQDDLLRRAESLIRRHHEQLRLQRQESEQRQAMERQQQQARPHPLIRV